MINLPIGPAAVSVDENSPEAVRGWNPAFTRKMQAQKCRNYLARMWPFTNHRALNAHRPGMQTFYHSVPPRPAYHLVCHLEGNQFGSSSRLPAVFRRVGISRAVKTALMIMAQMIAIKIPTTPTM